jgi:hypothetical protein
MTYKIYEISDLTNLDIVEMLKSSITDEIFKNVDLQKNYLYKYKDNPANLFYILDHGRYNEGSYFVVTDQNDKYIASAGWNPYTHDTALLLTRMLVIPEYRGSYILAKTVLQKMIDQSANYKNQWITFNEYNLTLYKWFERVEEGKRGALFNDWPDIYARFRPIGQKEINHTLQYVVELKNK